MEGPGKGMVTQGEARLQSLKVPELSGCVGSDQLGMGHFVGAAHPLFAQGGGDHPACTHPTCCG